MTATLTRRTVCAAVIALGLGLAANVSAQERPTDFDSWVIPGWTFTPSVSLGGMWDSNVALAANQVEGRRTVYDNLFIIEPQAQFDYRSPRTEFTTGYKGYVRRYVDVDQLNGFDQRGFLSLRRLASRRVTYYIRDEFADVPTTDEIELNGFPFARSGSQTNRLSAGVEARLTKYDDVSARYENTWVSFDNQTTFLTGGILNGIRLDYARRLSERTKVGAEYRIRYSSMNDDTRRIWFNDIGGVLSHALTPHVLLSLAGGYSSLRDKRLAENRGGAYGRAELTRATEHATASIYYERAYAPSFGFGGSSSSQELRGYVHMPFSRNRLYVRSSGAWRRTNPLILEDLALDSFVTDNTLGYAAARWLRLEVFHAFSRQDSTITGGEINRHRAGAQVVVSQPMRIR